MVLRELSKRNSPENNALESLIMECKDDIMDTKLQNLDLKLTIIAIISIILNIFIFTIYYLSRLNFNPDIALYIQASINIIFLIFYFRYLILVYYNKCQMNILVAIVCFCAVFINISCTIWLSLNH